MFTELLLNRLLLNRCNIGRLVGNSGINHSMYANDLVIFNPYSAELQQLLKVCSHYGEDYDIKFTAIKSNVMIVRSCGDRRLAFPVLYSSRDTLGNKIPWPFSHS